MNWAKRTRSSQTVVAIAAVCYYRPVRRLVFVISALVLLSACGHRRVQVAAPPTQPPNQQPTQATPPAASIRQSELEGLASYYAEPYHLRKTASGEVFDTYKYMTAAHRTLPFNTMVRVTNRNNGRF